VTPETKSQRPLESAPRTNDIEKSIGVYLDQNVFSQIANGVSEWEQVLTEARENGSAEVWAGPTHVLETIQCVDESLRQKLAQVILRLIESRRMWWGHEFEALEGFCIFVEQHLSPRAIRFPQYLIHRQETLRQLWLGGLALIACTGTGKFEAAMERLQRIKTTSRLLLARLAVKSDWVDRIVDVVEKWETTTENVFADFDAMSLDEMETEIRSLAGAVPKLKGKTLAKLNQNRRTISAAYGALEIGTLLQTIFDLPCELVLLFNLAEIRQGLLRWEKEKHCKILTNEAKGAADNDLAQPPLTAAILQGAIRAAGHVGLPSTSIAYDTVLWELQKKINVSKPPTAGLTFDADHSIGLLRFNIFVTTDETFASGLKTIAARITTSTGGNWVPQIAANPKQLREAIVRRTKQHLSSAIH